MDFDLNKRYCFYFNECCKIPHGSKNEKALSDYIVNFAKEHGLSYVQDELYNVIVYKKASAGYEEADPLILQAHIDMVCEKNKDSDHDFMCDPLALYVEDGLLKAKGTTLGADDCAGAAYMLAILEDDNLEHPALECAFTTQEEIGLYGAKVLKGEYFKGHRMISLDGGGEVTTLVSSAGGCNFDINKKLTMVDNDLPAYNLAIRGLSGGHSGGEIHKEKGNANVLAVRFLVEAQNRGIDITLVSINGGLKDNAIPRECDIVFTSQSAAAEIKDSFAKTGKDIAIELEHSDKGFRYELSEVKADKRMETKLSDNILNFIYLMPNGFQHRSMAIEGLTLTSLNLGVIATLKQQLEMHISIRSAIDSGIDHLVGILSKLCHLFELDYDLSARYPGWNYSEVSPLRDTYAKVLKELFDIDLICQAAHGGNECGIFKAMIPDIDIVSLGPVAAYIHTPDEQLDLASFDRTYAILTGIVSNCH